MVRTRSQRQSAENAPAGMFPEGGLVDRLDKAVSGPIFRVQVSWLVEAVIAVPGSMFGVTVQSLIMVPSWMPLILDSGVFSRVACTIACSTGSVMRFAFSTFCILH